MDCMVQFMSFLDRILIVITLLLKVGKIPHM